MHSLLGVNSECCIFSFFWIEFLRFGVFIESSLIISEEISGNDKRDFELNSFFSLFSIWNDTDLGCKSDFDPLRIDEIKILSSPFGLKLIHSKRN